MSCLRLVLVACLFAGCAQVIGLEERPLSSTASDGGVVASALCEQYCTKQAQLCTKENQGEQFYTLDGCRGTCMHYPTDEAAGPNANTLGCRLRQLDSVASLGEPFNTCAGAGPGGGAVTPTETAASCGTNCEGYCHLYAQVCSDKPIVDCLNKCKALPERPPPNTATADFMGGDDTLQCRIAHLTAAAAAQFTKQDGLRITHCSHSGLKSSVQCDLTKEGNTLRCGDFCKLVMNACTGERQVYENEQQCLGVCMQLTPGTATELTANNVRCRRENAYGALTSDVNQSAFCSNAGPAPASCGGGKCESYCALAEKACGEAYKTRFATPADCMAECAQLPDDGQEAVYATPTAAMQKRSLHCRLLHVARALGGEQLPSVCAAAVDLPGPHDCR